MNIFTPAHRLYRHARNLAFYLGITCAGIAVWWAAGFIRIVPTSGGCSYVREITARNRCVKHQLQHMVEKNGTDAAINRFDRIADRHPQLQNACHLAAHPYGIAEGQRMARTHVSFANISIEHAGFCSQGRYHGRIIGFRDTASLPQLHDSYSSDCVRKSAPEILQCGHAFGHLLLTRSRSISQSLAMCGKLPELEIDTTQTAQNSHVDAMWISHQSRLECTKGAMMQLGTAVRNKRLTRPSCDQLGASFARTSCALSFPVMMIMSGEKDEAAVFSCTTFSSARLRNVCGFGVGASNPDSDEPCTVFSGNLHDICKTGQRSIKKSNRRELTEGLGDYRDVENV